MQAKLHRWAAADPGRRFDDLFNFVHDPATLIVAFDRVAGNTGSRTAGVDGLTVADVEEQVGVPGFLDDLRARLRAGTFRPLPVRERKIPKPGGSGKVRSLGIPTVAAKCDRSQCVVRFSADHPSVPRVVGLPGDGVVLQAARRPVGVRL
jgi:RNA-directed DNA polymerase